MQLELITVLSFAVIYTSVFWLLILLEHRHEVRYDPRPKRFPSITIIIPAYNEEKTIEKSIKSALELEYPGKKDVIVVDDGSKDGTYKVAAKYSQKVKVLRKRNGGKADAMNYALKHVKTELYACLDADSFAKKDALLRMVGYFKDPQVASVTPAMKVFEPSNILQKVQWLEYLTSILQRKMAAALDMITVTPGPLSIYRTDVIRKLGGYDTGTVTEDMEIAYRLHANGYKIENSANAEVFTIAPPSIGELYKQRLRWTRGSYQNLRQYWYMVFNRRYGTLGMVLLPLSMLAIFLAMPAFVFSVYLLVQSLQSLAANIYYSMLYGFYFDFDLVRSFLATNFYYLFVGSAVFLLGTAVLFFSHGVSGEKVSLRMKAAYVAYVLIYFLFLNFMWIASLLYEITGADNRW